MMTDRFNLICARIKIDMALHGGGAASVGGRKPCLSLGPCSAAIAKNQLDRFVGRRGQTSAPMVATKTMQADRRKAVSLHRDATAVSRGHRVRLERSRLKVIGGATRGHRTCILKSDNTAPSFRSARCAYRS